MDNTSKLFDNVLVRSRSGRCLIASVVPPFRTAHWPDLSAIASEVGIAPHTPVSLGDASVQARFLTALADRGGALETFRPRTVEFKERREDLRHVAESRRRHCGVIFRGPCSREVVLGAIEVLADQMSAGGVLDVQFKEWDALSEWSRGQDLVRDVSHYVYRARQCRGTLTLFSELEKVDDGVWRFLYDRPHVRIGWIATDLLGCGDASAFERYCVESIQFANLHKLSEAGAWPHAVLPVGATNAKLLPDMASTLTDVMRGGTIDVVPAPLLLPRIQAAAPDVEEYVGALLAVWRSSEIPVGSISPFSWVAARVESETPLVGSPAAIGAEIAVLGNGDAYAGEWGIESDCWRLGNVLNDPGALRWERLDAVPEACSNCMKPEACKACDWRYRCGGPDASVLLRPGGCISSVPSALRGGVSARQGPDLLPEDSVQSTRFDLYCGPRKALFEELLWGSAVAAVRQQVKAPRDLLELHADGISFKPCL